jgi:hypothetical protein
MFEPITINFTNPICDCNEEGHDWEVLVDYEGKPLLRVWCVHCKKEEFLEYKDFRATFHFTKPYPKLTAEQLQERAASATIISPEDIQLFKEEFRIIIEENSQ